MWTNFHWQSAGLPVEGVLLDGDYGTFTASAPFDVPSLNAGGRWLKLTGGEIIVPEGSTTGCLTAGGVDEILSAQDPERAFDKYFEDQGWQSGKALQPGEEVPAIGYLHGTFEADNIPDNAKDLYPGNPGFLWRVEKGTVATHGGYFIPHCR